ncbi:MAG: hypothetical protein GY847_08390 [Proteobacteria bacterium]|nr:hypothetical protein [Pseudomonadota bacterium]
MSKRFIQLLVAVVLLLPAAQSEAFVGVGARFAWDNYKKPILVYSGTNNPGYDVADYGGPNLTGAFHWGITDRLVLTVSLDLGFFSHKIYPFPTSNPDDVYEVKATFFTFGALLGAKFYFWDPKAGEAVLYLHGGFGKYFSKCGNDDALTQITDEDEFIEEQAKIDNEIDIVGGLASPWVIQLAIGAEFFATKSFSVGADILGIRFALSKGSGGQGDGRWSGEQNMLSFYIYSAITMSFNLSAGESSEDDEEDDEEDSWTQPAQQQQSDQQSWGGGGGGSGSGSGSWGATPAPAPAAQPQPAPAQSGWNSEPLPPPPEPEEPPPPPAKKRASSKKASSKKASSKKASSPPPPPPPGY